MQNQKVRWARLSIVSNTVLFVLKLAIGITSGSVSIIAEGLHSGVDLIASVITYVSVRISGREADHTHHYGHGKFENVAGVAEGILIFVGAGLIIREALPKLFHPHAPETLGWGLAVMALSSVVNLAVSQKLFSIAKKTQSPALEADAWHLRTDVYTSAGVLGGLLLIKVTGMPVFDPLVALIVAGFIMKAAYDITMEGLAHMLDVSLPPDELERIKAALVKYGGAYVEFHELRARKSGPHRFIDLHVVMPHDMSLKKAHDICDKIEQEIAAELPGSNVLIHPEPCGEGCVECAMSDSENNKCVVDGAVKVAAGDSVGNG